MIDNTIRRVYLLNNPSVSLPYTVTDQINEPRYPNFKGIIAAKRKSITTLSLADIGVDPAQVGLSGSWTTVTNAEQRPPASSSLTSWPPRSCSKREPRHGKSTCIH